jgi:ClpP class serine protease
MAWRLNRWPLLETLSRRRILALIAVRRDATVITLIHRQETILLLGIPLARYIDIDDAESVLRAIRETPPGKTIEIILHQFGAWFGMKFEGGHIESG